MLRVRDIMTRQTATLRSDATAGSAAWSLEAAHISGAPVRSPAGQLVGVISKSDLAALLRGPGVPSQVPVADAMTPAVWAVRPEEPALAAVQLMVDKGIHRVLVISRPERVDGIVSTTDVLRAVAAGKEFHSGAVAAGSPGETASEG